MKEEDKIMSLYCLLKHYDIAKKKKGFSYWKFINRSLKGGDNDTRESGVLRKLL